MSEMIRTFIAIPLGEPAIKALEQVQAQLRRPAFEAACRWVKPENIHLTLKFLGDVDASRIVEIEAALAPVCVRHTRFILHLGELGCFPDAVRPRVLWVGVQGEVERLAALQQDVEAAMAGLGFEPERRPFRPHLTLARVQERARSRDVAAIGATVQETEMGYIARVPADTVHLIKSELKRFGPVYTRLGHFELN